MRHHAPQKQTRRYTARKVTPKVVAGKVQRKNRQSSVNVWPMVRREKPGDGCRHYVRKNEVLTFLGLLPDWPELSEGLREIVLAEVHPEAEGWHTPGRVAICASERELTRELGSDYVENHAAVLRQLKVPFAKHHGDGESVWYEVEFTDATMRAFMLRHVLLHELGHHHDRMTTRRKKKGGRGEGYAEQYARKYEQIVFNRYVEVFGLS